MTQWTTGHQWSPSKRSAEASVLSTESSMSGSASGRASGSSSGTGNGTLEYELPPKPSTLEQAVNELVNNHVSQRRASVQWGVHRSLLQRPLASVKYGMLCVLCLVFCALCFVFCVSYCACNTNVMLLIVMLIVTSLSRLCFRLSFCSSFRFQEQ